MIEIIDKGVYLLNGKEFATDTQNLPSPAEARENTITYGILRSHDVDGSKGDKMRIKFDAMMSYAITSIATSSMQPVPPAWINSPSPTR